MHMRSTAGVKDSSSIKSMTPLLSQSSKTMHMESSVSRIESSFIQSSKTMHVASSKIPEGSSMPIKPSKTSQVMETKTKEITTPRPSGQDHEIGCGPNVPVINVPKGGSANFTTENYPNGYPSFSMC